MDAGRMAQLLAELQALPEEPAGHHLTDEECVAFVLEEMTPAQEARVDTHLATCPRCTQELEAFFAAAETFPQAAWAQQHPAFVQRLRAGVGAVWAGGHAWRWLHVLTAVAFATAHLARTHRRAPRFETEGLFQDWTTDAGLTCVLHEDEHAFVFTVDSRDAAHEGALVRFALTDTQTGDAAIGGLLVLHADPFNAGHYGGSARLSDDVPIPEHCQPHLTFVALDPTHRPDRDGLLAAATAAYDDADRQVWHAWAQREAQEGRLSQDIADAVCAVCEHPSPPWPGTSFTTQQADEGCGRAAA